MSYGKEIFRPKYKETMDSLNTIKDNYYALDQEYQWSSKEKDEEIERLNNIIKEAIEFIYENAYNEERNYQVDDLWYEIPKLLEILNKEDDKQLKLKGWK